MLGGINLSGMGNERDMADAESRHSGIRFVTPDDAAIENPGTVTLPKGQN